MDRRTSLDLTLTLGVLALAACGERTIPTQPESAGNPPPAAPSMDQPGLLSSGLGTWTSRAPMPTGRWDLAGNVVSNSSGQPILYALGGNNFGTDGSLATLSRVEAYNAVTNSWSRKANLPHPRARTNGAAVIAGKIYVSGGLSSSGGSSNSLYVYDPATNTWTTKANMPVASFDGVSAAINGKLYVLVANCPTCSRLYRYDPGSNTWIRRADCPQQHARGAGGVIDGKFYVVDGSPNGGLDVYDPVTNTWTTKWTGGSRDSPAATVLGKKLYILGGFLMDASGETGEIDFGVFAYDPATNTSSEKAHMIVAREGFVARTVTFGGVSHILAVGGTTDGGSSRSVELYTP